MAQFYIARFGADPLIYGVPFQVAEGEELVAAAVLALAIHASHHSVDDPWEIRIAGPFPTGPERVVFTDPKPHLGRLWRRK
jgi:hypothetical protein